MVKNIYGLTEQVTGHLSSYSDFSRVALVEWPKPNVFALGFVTGQCELKGDKGDRNAIYIPTVPNPTSGMFALMSKSEVYDTNISVEEALKLVLSGGIVATGQTERCRCQGTVEESRGSLERAGTILDGFERPSKQTSGLQRLQLSRQA